jgi:hypothetical protein
MAALIKEREKESVTAASGKMETAIRTSYKDTLHIVKVPAFQRFTDRSDKRGSGVCFRRGGCCAFFLSRTIMIQSFSSGNARLCAKQTSAQVRGNLKAARYSAELQILM